MHNKRDPLNWTRLFNLIIRSAVKAIVPTSATGEEIKSIWLRLKELVLNYEFQGRTYTLCFLLL